MSRKGQDPSQNRAVAYVRMSTEHQQYSTSNQLDVIREYARRQGIEITKIYSDDGKSGLMFDSGDQPALEERLVKVLGDREWAKSLGAAGRKRVEAEFDMRQMYAKYLDQYLQLLHAHSA